jgi:hypothetical protein
MQGTRLRHIGAMGKPLSEALSALVIPEILDKVARHG